MPVIEQKTTNKNKVDFDLNRLDKSKTTIFSKYPFFIRSVELERGAFHGNRERSACRFQCRRVRLGVAVGGEGEGVMLRPTMQARMLHKIHPTSVFENSIWGGFYVNYNSVTMDNVFQSAESNESSCVCAASTSKRN